MVSQLSLSYGDHNQKTDEHKTRKTPVPQSVSDLGGDPSPRCPGSRPSSC